MALDHVRLRLVFADPPAERVGHQVTVIDLTSAIYDFNLVYELAVMSSLEQYSDYDFSNFFLLGRKRPVSRQHQLRVERVSKRSPLELLTQIPPEVLYPLGTGGGIAFLWSLRRLVQAVYTVDLDFSNARLRKRVENQRLRNELDDLQQGAASRRLEKRVRDERLQLQRAEIDADDLDFDPAGRQ
jgi:hypothetical protein